MDLRDKANRFMRSEAGCAIVGLAATVLVTGAAMFVYHPTWFVIVGTIIIMLCLIAFLTLLAVSGAFSKATNSGGR